MRFSILTLAIILAASVSAAPTEVSVRNVDTKGVKPAAALNTCGVFYKIEEEGQMPVYNNGHYENLEEFTHMSGFENRSCGFCMVFR